MGRAQREGADPPTTCEPRPPSGKDAMTTRVLITGVAGMIGSHLLDALLSSGRYDVVGIDNLSFG